MTTQLLYLITFQSQPRLQYFIEPCLASEVKSGGFGKPIAIKQITEVPIELVDETDDAIWELLASFPQASSAYPIEGKTGGKLIDLLLKTGREYFESNRSKKLKHGKLKKGKTLVLVIPFERHGMGKKEYDLNQHLFTWNFQAINNLLLTTGFEILENRYIYGAGYFKLLPLAKMNFGLYRTATNVASRLAGIKEMMIIARK